MKTSNLLLLIPFLLIACQKATISPKPTPVVISPVTTPVTTPVITAVNTDTLPDKAAFKLALVKDSLNYDDTMFLFKKDANPDFDPMEDAQYFQGNGQVNLSSISADDRDLAINDLPYAPGASIGLNVQTKADGAFSLKINYESKLPSNTHIWLKDAYLKDSIDLRTGNYNFTVSKADTNTFGSKRFKLVVKNS